MRPLVDALPDLAQRAREIGIDVDVSRATHRIFATRSMAREVVERLPDGAVVLDCCEVEAMLPNVAAELLALRPQASIINANEDVAWAWETARKGGAR